jgi:Rps23 Pro-64 3,4-dihydroxylase Tpa1-like proline 4-hydroxylase
MEFVNLSNMISAKYENYPYPHTIIENFLNEDKISEVLCEINKLKDEDADHTFLDPKNPFEYRKIAFSKNYGDLLKKLFVELNSVLFITFLENLTGIQNLIVNDITLAGAGIHRIKKNGYLQLHTDFNFYDHQGTNLDRRINLLIYMNPDWKPEYKGALLMADKEKQMIVKQIFPILNRCLIFNTSNKSIHGHPEPLDVPEHICRQSIAVYYYTKNQNGKVDFEGDAKHTTLWHSSHDINQ